MIRTDDLVMNHRPLTYLAALAIMAMMATPAAAFEPILIGDVDGFGFTDTSGLVRANATDQTLPADVDGNGFLSDGEYLPDLNKDGTCATGSGDTFDHRSAEESSSSNGAQFTDRALDGTGAAHGTTYIFTFDPPGNDDVAFGADFYVNMVIGDFDTGAMSVSVDGGTPVDLEPVNIGSDDGQVTTAYATVPWSDVQDGQVVVVLSAETEPFLAIDYVLLSIETYADSDGDGIRNDLDNCIDLSNSDQIDEDQNGVGDACQDDDEDGYPLLIDCDDSAPSIHPGAPEDVCDLIDNDCDLAIDEGLEDADNDGVDQCSDCDDSDPQNYPGNAELACDQKDNDCDGEIDEGKQDADGDGVDECSDCDDADPNNAPGNEEICDGQDNNCDGQIPAEELDGDLDGQSTCAGDCDDADPSFFSGAEELCDFIDSDCDGSLVDEFSDEDADGTPSCVDEDDDNDGYPDTVDCGPTDALIHPLAEEACDAVDSDCDGSLVDEFDDLDEDGLPDCVDEDIDGDGDPNETDCDDSDATIYSGAPEICDDVDSDCDGSLVDEFDDLDGDGAPDCSDTDADGDGFASTEDCDDMDSSIYPDAPESCDDLDSDCDGDLVDEDQDLDSDGLPDCVDADDDGDGSPDDADCAPENPAIYPGAPESCDAVDSDCDESLVDEFTDMDGDGAPDCVDEDADGDGDPATSDCDDANPAIHAGAAELCDGVDNDCSGGANFDAAGEVDADGDGVLSCADCDDSDPQNYPGNAERCDGQDNDCDGEANYLGPMVTDAGADDGEPGELWDELDVDEDGTLACEGDCDDQNPMIVPGIDELCDGLDSNCNGNIPENEIDSDGDGQWTCEGDCNPDRAEIWAGAPELCDGIDNDCDGTIADEEFDIDGDGFTPCAGDCDDTEAGAHPDGFEGDSATCSDGIDNDCDGLIDSDAPECVDVELNPEVETVTGSDDSDSGCRAAQGSSGHSLLWLALLAILTLRARRQGRGDPDHEPARG